MVARTEGDTGIRVPVSPPSGETGNVLTDVVLERHRQVHLWGHNTTTPDGTGPGVEWCSPLSTILADFGADAATIEREFRESYEDHARNGGELTFMHFLREEVAEAFKEEDADKLYTELIQVAAVAVSWCEKIRQR